MLVLGASASALILAAPSGAMAQAAETVDVAKLMAPQPLPDRPLGAEDARVTVIEYASPTCPHCALFHNEIYPGFKSAYVDTGKVRFIVRPFVRNVLDAVVFMLAEAAGPEQYHNVIDTFFRTQAEWAASNTPRDAILVVAKQLGFTDQSFEAALSNQELFNGMEAMREQALNEFGLTGTPTFYVNGKKLTGEQTLEQLAAEIDPLLA
jgi:protein-disulfide isomerase